MSNNTQKSPLNPRRVIPPSEQRRSTLPPSINKGAGRIKLSRKRLTDFDPYIRPEYLQGKPMTLQITAIAELKVYKRGVGTVTMPALHFAGETHVLLVNTTTTRALVAMFGMDPADYLDQWIQLVPATADSGAATIIVKRGMPMLADAAQEKSDTSDNYSDTARENDTATEHT
jgi:hypothetical protein